ncbi:MAG TPA: HEAT repeat domain-containing protein [Pirellulales bacterium]|jgi:HEAT repeat protein|nr:HEAT repeat domain-containing protein [Pirellulales bacterium]
MHPTRHTIRSLVFLAVWSALVATGTFAATGALAADNPNDPKEKEQKLIELLRSDSPAAEKAIACKQLAVYGSKDAVGELSRLLADERLASWARIALEALPGQEADQALVKALDQLQGRLLIGTINSIGVRRSANAVDPLTVRLRDKDSDVASAAAVALGHIGGDAATKSLRASLAGPVAIRAGVAEGCILCAERLVNEGRSAEAAEIYDEVRRAEVPKPRKLEAIRGAILARKSNGIPLLVEQLRAPDKVLFQIGLSAAREISGAEVAAALEAELVNATPDRAALLLVTLADRKGAVVSPAVIGAARSGPKPVRLAAIGVLGRLGGASCLSTLLEIGLEADEELAPTAKAALASLPGEGVDAEIASLLESAKGKVYPLLIEVVGERRIDATAALFKALEQPDAGVRAAALTALGKTIGPQGLSVLVSQVVAPKDPEDAKVAQQALRAACIRMPEREVCAAQLAAAVSRSPVATQCTLLEILGAMGGTKALATVAAAAKSSEPQLQDAGSRLLGAWMSVDAAPVLLDLAKTSEKYQVRALRGYIRLARQFVMPDAERAEMCKNAFEASNGHVAEQKLVLEILPRHPNLDTLKLAVKAAQVPELKDDGARVVMAIAQKLDGKSAEVRDVLAKIGLESVKLEIVKAEYGAGTNQKDVTETLRRHVGELPLISLPSPNYNASFGGDPVPGIVKQLKVQYRINGKAGEASFPEDAIILLPLPK